MSEINTSRAVIICLIAMFITSCFNNKTGKEYIVKLEDRVVNKDSKFFSSNMVPLEDVTTNTLIITKGMPNNDNPFAIKKLVVNPVQQVYEKYLNGEISEERYMNYITSYKIDTVSLKSNFISPNEIYIYTALNNETRHKYLIADLNCNLDFSDDKLYTFSLDTYDVYWTDTARSNQLPTFQIPITRGDRKDTMAIEIDPFDSYYHSPDTGNDYFLDAIGITQYYKQGEFLFMGQKINLTASYYNETLVSGDLPTNADIRLFQPTGTNFPPAYKIGDTLILLDRKVTISKGENNTLLIQDFGILKDNSKIGDILPKVNAMDIESNNSININELIKNKYVLIDIWGSWCGPCIQAMPKLKELSELLDNREDAMIIGIASERDKSAEKPSQIIKEKKLPWLNLWVFMDIKGATSPSSFIIGILKVEHFPTYIIVDKAGRIVWRSDVLPLDKSSTDEAISYFKNLIAGAN